MIDATRDVEDEYVILRPRGSDFIEADVLLATFAAIKMAGEEPKTFFARLAWRRKVVKTARRLIGA